MLVKRARPNTALIGIAGVHHVVSELSRRGLVALPTIRNTAGFDILVTSPDGRDHANIQVKTSAKKARFFHMPPSKRIKTEPADLYVLLRWLRAEQRYEGFMLTGAEARKAVQRTERRQLRSIRKGTRNVQMPTVWVEGRNGGPDVAKWRDRWLAWRNPEVTG